MLVPIRGTFQDALRRAPHPVLRSRRMAEELTREEQAALAPYVSNLAGPVFALVNLPEVVKGALFARYSRSPKSLRRLFLDEFLGPGGLEAARLGGAGGDAGARRAEQLFERVFVEYGDDSVAQLGGVHLACEGSSNILTKVLEWGRLMAYLEQSTRYIPYDDRPSGRYRYYVPSELPADLRAQFVSTLDGMFDAYREWLPRIRSLFEERYPRESQTSEAVHRATIRAKALDTLRGLLPAATVSNVGIFGTGQAYEQLLLRMRSHSLAEVRNYADLMLVELRKVIPAFLQRVDNPDRGVAWSAYLGDARQSMRGLASSLLAPERPRDRAEVTLTDFDPDGEIKVVAAALYSVSDLPDDQLLDVARRMSSDERRAVLQTYVGTRSNRRQKPGRAFERTSYRFDILSDYGAFRDLQRHRLLTLEWQQLSPNHGYVMPEAIDAAGGGEMWKRVMKSSARLYRDIVDAGLDDVAPYAIVMAYRIRFFMQMNAREALHVIELRTAPQGHPSYRRICQDMHQLIEKEAGHVAIAAAMSFVDHSSVELERLESERASERKMAILRHGTDLYPEEFVAGLPEPHSWERRPLLKLLRGERLDPSEEIERIERWFRELRADQGPKKALRGNLRSLKTRQFWSGLYELMTARVFAEQGWTATYEPKLGASRPDFLVECSNLGGFKFIAEVMTAFQSRADEQAKEELSKMAEALNQVRHRVGVFIDEVQLPTRTISLDGVRRRVRDWLDSVNPLAEAQLELTPPEWPLTLRLSSVPGLRDTAAGIVDGIQLPGGRIDSDKRLAQSIRRKVAKYRQTKQLGVPLILFLWEGDWIKISDTSLEWALFGREQFVRERRGASVVTHWRRAGGGLFGFGGDGSSTPRHTRLSAVAY